MTDCDSLYEHLIAPRFNTIENKRLAIDLMSLRQQIWERDGERTQYVDHDSGDYPRWIDTSTMIADPLTKHMDCDRLKNTLATGILDLTPTEESLKTKERNRSLRKKQKEQQQAAKEEKLDAAEKEQDNVDSAVYEILE